MKTTIKLLTLAFVLFATACNNDDEMDMLNSLWRNITQNEARIDALEKWCAQANTNISSLQTIVNVLESNGMVTSITPVMEGGVEIGYTITFSNHDPITIYHGKDGKDGQNGANGQNGTSPIVGVAQSGGVYYWTLDGEWLLDADGNKLPVSGKDGANGENGQNGSNGQNGVTPQLKIENDYWWISYDNGNTWTQLGKAKGEDGENGQNGAKGDKGDTGDKGDKGDKGDAGDSMFQSVTQDTDNVYFILQDGTVIKLSKDGSFSSQVSGGAVSGMIDGHYYVDLDLPSGTKWATCNVGSNCPEGFGYYFAWGEVVRKDGYFVFNYSLTPSSVTDTISHTEFDASTVLWGEGWMMPTQEQWSELYTYAHFVYTTYNDIDGVRIYGPNGNSFFLPAASFFDGKDNVHKTTFAYACGINNSESIGKDAFIYAATPKISNSYVDSGVESLCFQYYMGFPIRPVLFEKK